jgi:hypothetical protein
VRKSDTPIGKERIGLKPELICIAAPKDFEEGFQVRVAEEAITPQIVSIVMVTWVTSFRQASSSRQDSNRVAIRNAFQDRLSPPSEFSVRTPDALWTLARQVFKRRGSLVSLTASGGGSAR